MYQISKKHLLFSLLGISTLTLANTGKIKLVEKNSKQAVAYANVCWESCQDKMIKGNVLSNKNGTAQTDLSSGQLAVVSVNCVGYKAFLDTISIDAETTIQLEEDIFNLEQFTVTGTRTKHTLKDTPVLTQLITAEELKGRGLSTVKDVLAQEMPSIEMNRHGYGTAMQMQGLEAQYTLVLIDGERMAGESGGTVDLSRINVANIEQIEIVRGATSSLYGSNAMGGVINIITKKPKKKWDVSAHVQYEQMNEKNNSTDFIEKQDEDYEKEFYRRQDLPNLNADITLGYRNKTFYSNTYAGYKSADLYTLKDTKGQTKKYLHNDSIATDPVSTSPTIINGFMDYTISNKTGFSVGKHWKAEVRANYYSHEEADSTKNNVHDRFKNYTLGGFLDYKINNTSNIRLSHNYDKYDKYDVKEKKENQNDLNYSNVFHNTKLNYTLSVKEKHNLFFGMENLYESLETDMFICDTLTTEQASDVVFIAQDEFKMNKNWMLVAGARLGNHSTFETHISPSATLKYSIKDIACRLTYARGYRSPSLKELYMNWSHMGMFTIIGSTDLQPETNNYYTFSADYINLDNKINVTAITSFNQINNKIDGVWANNETEYLYKNLETQKVFSAELILKWMFLKSFSFKGGYVYTKILQDEDAINLSTATPHSFSFQLDYSKIWKNYALGANINGKIIGKKSYNVLDDNDLYYQVEYPMYSIWNFTVNQKLFNSLSFDLGVKNIFDFTAPIVTFNSSASIGRRLFVGITYNL